MNAKLFSICLTLFFISTAPICEAITKQQCIDNMNNVNIQCFSDPGCWKYDGSWTGDLSYCNGNGNCYSNCN